MSTIGVIYYASGDKYRAQAVLSAESVKRIMPNMFVKLYTDTNFDNRVFDKVIQVPHEGFNYQAKIRAFLEEDQLDRYVFLDTDTLVLRPFEHVFELLDVFDLVAAHEPYRTGEEYGVNRAFGELNTGVVFVKRSKEIKELFNLWRKEHDRLQVKTGNPNLGDQISLRNVLHKSSVKLWVLHPEYNFRTVYPCMAGFGSPVYIVHGPQTLSIENIVNRSNGFRIFLNSWEQFNQDSFGFTSLKSDQMFRMLNPITRLVRNSFLRRKRGV